MSSLVYITQKHHGFERRKKGKIFYYVNAKGKTVTKTTILARIDALRIPPAWKNVWIAKSANGHIQAYGYDKLERKQYIYHPRWTKKQSENKYDHLLLFGKSIVTIRRKVSRDLALKNFKKETMLAAVVKCLDITPIRIGSKQYTSQGLLTLTKKHLRITGSTIQLDFEGKSKKQWHLEFSHKKIASLLKSAKEKPGQFLFKFYDKKNTLHTISVSDVNIYLKNITGIDTTAKEFRTWRASSIFIQEALNLKKPPTQNVLPALIKKVAHAMNNTPAICKNSYIHPILLSLFLENKITLNGIKPKRDVTLPEQVLLRILKSEVKDTMR